MLLPGISISPGTYWVTASAENSFHIYMRCADGRNTPFELDFSGVFFYFTVRPQTLHSMLLHAVHS